MAERRMMSKKIIESARFLKMPISTQCLYFHLLLNADDDGVVEAYSVVRLTGCSEDDLKILYAKGFVSILNDDLVTYITDWREHNKLRADRKIDSIYKNLLLKILPDTELLQKKARADRPRTTGSLAIQSSGTSQGHGMDGIGKDSIGKDSIGKDSIGKDSIGSIGDKSPKTSAKTSKKRTFKPPTLAEVNDYILEKGIHNVSAKDFVDYYEAGNWHDAKGNKVKSWKQKLLTWARHENGNAKTHTSNESRLDEALSMLDEMGIE